MISVTNAKAETKLFTLAELEQFFNFRYISRLEFDHYEVEQWLRKKCQQAHKKHSIDLLPCWLGQLHSKQLEQCFLEDVALRWVCPEIGYGIFTNKPIKKWDFIGEYVGLVRRRNILMRNVNDYCFMYPRAWLSWKPFTIDSQAQGNLTRFINHSDQPNLESLSVYWDGVFHVIFRAIEDIAVGTELRYDYGSLYWQKRKKHLSS
ncbi:MAG: SET domain-containing protein-lysine N-methyltransferase [Verrucomicrobia bacterium]|nr:SET domain-containing protein-lysine N-methyltransferase [Verrucomicrobiota bacterium]MBS0647179.1 SET domain-containing protein-lysine N-methyltransferase [Verrucomicrobiota bacterium]